MPLPPKRCSKCGTLGCKQHRRTGWSSQTSYDPATRRKMRVVRDRAKATGWHCQHCRKPDPNGQVDHKINRKRGGTDDLTNLWWLCTSCHTLKTIAEARYGREQARKRRGKR